MKESNAVTQLKWLNKFLKCHDIMIAPLIASKLVDDCIYVARIICWEHRDALVCGVYFRKAFSLFVDGCVSNFDTGTKYHINCLYWQMGLADIQCWICHNDMPRILRCTRILIIGQSQQQVCHKLVCSSFMLWPKYSISPRLLLLPTVNSRYAVIDQL